MLETEKTFGTTTIYCDNEKCKSEFTHDGFDGYYDIKEACKKAGSFGWIIKYINGDYSHFCCRECYEEEEE